MQTVKKLSAILLAVFLCALTMAPATAFGIAAYDTLTATADDTTTFTKYLVVDDDANIPNVSFNFTIAPAASAIEATEDTLGVKVGPTIGTGENAKPSIAAVSFTSSSTTTNGLPTDEAGSTTDGKKYAVATATVEFTGVQFTEPGVYRYIITESSSTAPGVTNDATATRTLDVYVVNKNPNNPTNAELEIAGYVMYSGTVTAAPKADSTAATSAPENATKSSTYTNTLTTYELGISKEVTGNQGSKDKFFKFTVTIEGAGNATVVKVDTNGLITATKTEATVYEAATMTGTSGNGVETLTADADGEISHDFYLSSGDTVKLTGIPTGATYSVTETAEDYKSTAGTSKVVEGTKTYSDATSGTLNADTYTGYTNTKEGVIPTGIMLTVVPGVVIVAVAVAGLLLLSRKKKNAA